MRLPRKLTGQHVGQAFVFLTYLVLTIFSSKTMASGSFQIKIVKLNIPKQSCVPNDPMSSLKVNVCLSHHVLPPPINPTCTLGKAVKHGWSSANTIIQIPFSYTWSEGFTLSVRVSCLHQAKDGNKEKTLSHIVLAHSVSPSTRWTRLSSQSPEVHDGKTTIDLSSYSKSKAKKGAKENGNIARLDARDIQKSKVIKSEMIESDMRRNEKLGVLGFAADFDTIQMPESEEAPDSFVQYTTPKNGYTENAEPKFDADSILFTSNIQKYDYLRDKRSNDTYVVLRVGTMTISFRVVCHQHYFGKGCILYCKPRNDFIGHVRCTDNGTRICLDGWKGKACTEAVCPSSCLPSRGRCLHPLKCTCLPGWFGDHCENCQTSRGCVHGLCYRPTQCLCHKGWTGTLCDKEIDYEQMLCQHGGTRIPGKKCLCTAGHTGLYCEFTLCRDNICLHNGTCLLSRDGPYCVCPPSYGGKQCQWNINNVMDNNKDKNNNNSHGNLSCVDTNCNQNKAVIDPCDNVTCLNNGLCRNAKLTRRPYCACSALFTGRYCETLNNPCDKNPCKNGGKCSIRLGDNNGDIYSNLSMVSVSPNTTFFIVICECKDGFVGERCDTRQDMNQGLKDCGSNSAREIKHRAEEESDDICKQGNVCQNGGECVLSDRKGSFWCSCKEPWVGEFCEIDLTDPCASQVCLNGGECRIESEITSCDCPSRFTGHHCEIPVRVCHTRTCHHGGICIEHKGLYSCVCRRNYFGKLCEKRWPSEKIKVPFKLHVTHSRSETCQSFSAFFVISLWIICKILL